MALDALDESQNDSFLQSDGLEFWTKWALHVTQLFLLLASGPSFAWMHSLCEQQQGVPFQQVFGGTIFEKKLILIQVFCRE